LILIFRESLGSQTLVFGGMNYIEREIEGLQPDVALCRCRMLSPENP